MSFEKQPGGERKSEAGEIKRVLTIVAPVLAFFAGQQFTEAFGRPQHETVEVSSPVELNGESHGDMESLIININQKINQIEASMQTGRDFFDTPLGEVQVTYGSDGASDNIFTISRRESHEGWDGNLDTSVYRITDDSLHLAKGNNIAPEAFGNSGEASIEYAVHFKWNHDTRNWEIVDASTVGEGSDQMTLSAESQLAADLVILDSIAERQQIEAAD